MKKKLLFTICTLAFILSSVNAQNQKLKITVGNNNFTATLNNNETVDAFVAMLPLDVDMTEMGGYEKFYYLPQNLPGSASNVGTTYKGDLMIWSSNCLVLFYTTRSTSYSYIRLGRIDNTTGLREAVGSGNVRIKFELDNTTSIENMQGDVEMYKIRSTNDFLEVSDEVKQLSLYSLNGTLVGNSEGNTISTTNLNSGIYLLRISTKDMGIITKKIIKG
ncbi:MAG: cyclophilin-like fold protein [Dysgonomonas sp.]